MITSSDEDLLEYKRWCQYWMNRLHLNDWDVRWAIIKHEDTACNAWAQISPGTRKVLFCLEPEREEYVDLEELARHECLEVLLGDIGSYMTAYYSHSLIDDEIHRVINRLMEALGEGVQ